MADQFLPKELLRGLTSYRDVTQVSYEALLDDVRSDKDIQAFQPDGVCQLDPRSGERIVYSEARASRPHDYPVPESSPKSGQDIDCVVCQGKTTSIIDWAELSEGFTFINKNLFPVLYPLPQHTPAPPFQPTSFSPLGQKAVGLHFLQWPSNYHDRDFHNMPLEDIAIVLERLAFLERQLLHTAQSTMPESDQAVDGLHYGYVGIIKNVGRLVGGSLVHGHLQIVHTNILPWKVENDMRFWAKHHCAFSQFLLQQNPPALILRTYQDHFTLLIPYFMRRYLDCMLVGHDSSKSYLHHFNAEERFALGQALQEVTRSLHVLLRQLGRELAYNLVFHTGPIGGFYVEILPYTQEMGGYEHLGLFICQGSPALACKLYKEVLG